MTEYEQNIEIMKDLRNRIDAVLLTHPNTGSIVSDIPDPIKHKYISFVKSFFRIAAGTAVALGGYEPGLMPAFLKVAGGLLILAEILGIAEEMV